MAQRRCVLSTPGGAFLGSGTIDHRVCAAVFPWNTNETIANMARDTAPCLRHRRRARPPNARQDKAQASLAFNEHIIANDLRGGYHVAVADLNRDGWPDIIALAAGGPDLVWYENPGWERHVLISGLHYKGARAWAADASAHRYCSVRIIGLSMETIRIVTDASKH